MPSARRSATRYRPAAARVGSEGHDEAAGPARRRQRRPLCVERQQHAIQPHREPDARSRLPAEGLREPVVAAPGVDRGCLVRRQRARDPLERRPRVVVETADQSRVEQVGHARLVQSAPNGGEVRRARLAQVIGDRRRGRARSPCRPSTLQSNTRNGFFDRRRPAVLVELVAVRLEVVDEPLAIRGAAVLVADRVQVQDVLAQAALPQEPLPEHDHLDVGRRRPRPRSPRCRTAGTRGTGPPAAVRAGTPIPT